MLIYFFNVRWLGNSLSAAMIWHCYSLHNLVQKFCSSRPSPSRPQGRVKRVKMPVAVQPTGYKFMVFPILNSIGYLYFSVFCVRAVHGGMETGFVRNSSCFASPLMWGAWAPWELWGGTSQDPHFLLWVCRPQEGSLPAAAPLPQCPTPALPTAPEVFLTALRKIKFLEKFRCRKRTGVIMLG